MSNDHLPEATLDQELRELKGRLFLPEARDFSERVVARIEAGETPRPRVGWWVLGQRPGRWALLTGAAAVLVAFGLVLAIWPGARHAVASWLGLRGVEITLSPTPSVPASPEPGALDLGERVTLQEAAARADFALLLPPGLGPPDEVYFSEARAPGVVSLVWKPADDLPGLEADPTVAVLISEFRATFDDPPLVSKVASPEGVEPVTVAGSRGYWLEAGHSVVFRLLDPEGKRFTDTPRLAGSVLLWERGELTIRLESQLSQVEAVALAESLR